MGLLLLRKKVVGFKHLKECRTACCCFFGLREDHLSICVGTLSLLSSVISSLRSPMFSPLSLTLFSLSFFRCVFIFLFSCFLSFFFLSMSFFLSFFLSFSLSWTVLHMDATIEKPWFTVCLRTENEMKTSSAPRRPYDISILIEHT